MSYKYNPDVTDMRNAYEVAYGEMGVYHLLGALFANITDTEIERLYKEALDKVKEDMKKAGTL
jgi:hypothetical protein